MLALLGPLLILTTACGAYEEQSQNASAGENKTAYLVANVDSMPDCDKTIEGQLIYVEESNQFFACKKQKWDEVNIKGEDGADGKDGTNGVDGEDGVDGRDGENGQNGKDGSNGVNGIAGRDGRDGQDGRDGAGGSDAPYVSDKDWIHPVSGVKWFIAGQVSNTWVSSVTNRPQMGDDNYLCPEGSHSPSDAEYQDAFKAGIWSKISSITTPVVDGSIVESVQNNSGVIVNYYRFRYARSTGLTDLQSSSQYNGGGQQGTALCIVD